MPNPGHGGESLTRRKLQRSSGRLDIKSEQLIPTVEQPCPMVNEDHRKELTDLMAQQRERLIEVRRRSSRELSSAIDAPQIALDTIDENIEAVTLGLQTLTRKVSMDILHMTLAGEIVVDLRSL